MKKNMNIFPTEMSRRKREEGGLGIQKSSGKLGQVSPRETGSREGKTEQLGAKWNEKVENTGEGRKM